jgi:predicted nucleic acid-binding protein
VKLAIKEKNSKEARITVQGFLEKGYSLHTVDISLAESLNAIWKHANIHKDLTTGDAKQAMHDLIQIHDKLNIITARELAEKATNIMFNQNVTIYDALYIAATQHLNATLYTADQKLHNTATKITNARLLKP